MLTRLILKMNRTLHAISSRLFSIGKQGNHSQFATSVSVSISQNSSQFRENTLRRNYPSSKISVEPFHSQPSQYEHQDVQTKGNKNLAGSNEAAKNKTAVKRTPEDLDRHDGEELIIDETKLEYSKLTKLVSGNGSNSIEKKILKNSTQNLADDDLVIDAQFLSPKKSRDLFSRNYSPRGRRKDESLFTDPNYFYNDGQVSEYKPAPSQKKSKTATPSHHEDDLFSQHLEDTLRSHFDESNLQKLHEKNLEFVRERKPYRSQWTPRQQEEARPKIQSLVEPSLQKFDQHVDFELAENGQPSFYTKGAISYNYDDVLREFMGQGKKVFKKK